MPFSVVAMETFAGPAELPELDSAGLDSDSLDDGETRALESAGMGSDN